MPRYTIIPTTGPTRRRHQPIRWTLAALPADHTDGDPMPGLDPSALSYVTLAEANAALRRRLEDELLGSRTSVVSDLPRPDEGPVTTWTSRVGWACVALVFFSTPVVASCWVTLQ